MHSPAGVGGATAALRSSSSLHTSVSSSLVRALQLRMTASRMSSLAGVGTPASQPATASAFEHYWSIDKRGNAACVTPVRSMVLLIGAAIHSLEEGSGVR